MTLTDPDGFQKTLIEAASRLEIDLSQEQTSAFTCYYEKLVDWNQRVNLTSITSPAEVAVKHMVDSLCGYRSAFFPTDARVVDVGTGAGFPGLPLRIWKQEIQLTLLDALNKRLSFLSDVCSTIGLANVKLVHARAEDAARQNPHREKYDVAVSRAVARLNVLCELCLPFVAVGGYFIAYKGAQGKTELQEAKRAISTLGGAVEDVRNLALPLVMEERNIIYIKKVSSSPAGYPRRAGTPEKKPLL